MSILASRITGDSTVCLSVCLDEHQRKYQSPRHGPFVRGIRVVVTGRFPLTKGHLSGNRFHLMTSRHKNARYWPSNIPVSVPDSYKSRMSYKNQLSSPVIVHIGSCCMETLFRITVPLWSSGLRLISITIGHYSVVSVSYLLWVWTNCWVYNRVSDLRSHDAHTTSL